MTKGFAVRLWEDGQRKVNKRLAVLAVLCLVLAVVFTCTAHGQAAPGGGGGNVFTNGPGFGQGTQGPAQAAISKGLGGVTLLNGTGAVICGAAGQWWCSLGFGFAGLTSGSIEWSINYSGLPDGGGLGGGTFGNVAATPCHGCKLAPHNGGGSFDAKLTVTRGTSNPFAMPRIGNSNRLRNAFTTIAPRPDWRSMATVAIQNNLLAPRFQHLPNAVPVHIMRTPIAKRRVQ